MNRIIVITIVCGVLLFLPLTFFVPFIDEFETFNCITTCESPKITIFELFQKQYYVIDSFEDCVSAGNPVMESHPRQCKTIDGKHFVEEINS